MASRCSLIERYATFASRIARGMHFAGGTVIDADDIESAALLGLIDAVDRFEPGRGVPFEAYAAVRIRGTVVDEVRRLDERGRADRRPRGTESSVSLDALLERGATEGLTAEDDVDERFEHEDLQMRVQKALGRLPPRQRELLGRYYGEELTLREAAWRMGISEARACQLHGRAIQNLRRTLVVHVATMHLATTAAA